MGNTTNLRLDNRIPSAITIKIRSSFLNAKCISLGANLPPKRVSEMVPRGLNRIMSSNNYNTFYR